MNKNRKFIQAQMITSPNGVSPCVITKGDSYIALEEFGQLSGGRFDKMNEQSRRIYDIQGLAPTCHTCGGGNTEPKIAEPIICASRGRNPNNPSDRTAGTQTQQRLEVGGDISNTLTTVTKDIVVEPAKKYYRIRKLTPLECFRLMGVRDEDYQKVAANQSDSSLYHLAGDSIVVDVLMAIFGEML
jgi:DNA (cytosine-5)-methyltransferase 1